MKKKIIIIVIAILIVVIGYYIRSLILKSIVEKNKTAQEKFIDSMREKYKDINSYTDFSEGIKYVAYPSLFGYDLKLLKQKQAGFISLDELRFIYEKSKVGIGKDNDSDIKFLDIMHKIYP